jgi:hypothetical protein
VGGAATAVSRDPVVRALTWLGAQGEHFSPPGTLSTTTAKPAVELGIMLGCLTRPERTTGEASSPAVAELVGLMEAIGQRPDVRSRPVGGTADVLLHAVICGVLERAGRPAAHHRNMVRRALAAGIVDHADRLPYHMMEERLILEWGGFAHDLPNMPELAARSMLSRRLRALRLTARTAYQLTHDVMFLAGLDPSRGVPADIVDFENLPRVLADLLVSFAGEGHWDLLGELLLCWDCLRLPHDRLYYQAWALLLAQQAADGSFPGPPPPRGADPDPARGAARFGHRYHTTLVAVLALDGRTRRAADAGRDRGVCGLRPRPERARAATTDRVAAVRRDAEWLVGLLERTGATAPAVASGVLVGTWLCAAVDPEIASSVPIVAGCVADLLGGAERFETAPPGLILTAHALLRRTRHDVPGMAMFVEQVSAVLAARPPISAAADLALCEKRVLLHRLGLAAPPLLLAPAQARSIVDGLTLRPTAEQLTAAVLAAESSTGHGTVDTGADGDPSTVLERHAVRRFRSGELATGCFLVRAAHHLRPVAADRAEEFADHLLLQQRPDGGYGDLLGVREHAVDLDLDLRLHLPTTLTCLWTLAELYTDFRLYRSVGATAGAAFAAL